MVLSVNQLAPDSSTALAVFLASICCTEGSQPKLITPVVLGFSCHSEFKLTV